GTSAAAWPLVARGQQQPGSPVLGVLRSGGADSGPRQLAFHRGLSETGFVEGRNLIIEYRVAENRPERLRVLLDDLVRRQVTAIFAASTLPAMLAKAATAIIPIVFLSPTDPVEVGLVASLNRPGGNLTGISSLNVAVAAKRLQLMHELLPAATLLAVLMNPASHVNAEIENKEWQGAAGQLGVPPLTLNASNLEDLATAFAKLDAAHAGGLVIGSDPLFFGNPQPLVALAARYRVPTMYPAREATVDGGLMNYGTDLTEVWHQAGIYC